ncbi:MAG TPA: RNA methyltransferase [Oligoflexia bacterium]|nr:RNA methyltransferase [Oligoflexia bacterium]HMP27912.1 RNA methyltransferase [Oligoflexia bacterium]
MAKILVALLHEHQLNKEGALITTSVTLLDVHDIARSSMTYGIESFFVVHPSESMRSLVGTMARHWQEGYGATYNPTRKEALSLLQVRSSFSELLGELKKTYGEKLKIISTSARFSPETISFVDLKSKISADTNGVYLILFGTGWGMSDQLMALADLRLQPICGQGEYNHLSVRSACAIVLDRLFGVGTAGF